MRRMAIGAAALGLAACATTGPDEGNPPTRAPSGECDASGAQQYLAETATGELGAHLLEETGAGTLRWVPPHTAVTMDFRPDRLTVSYDEDMIVTEIKCG